MGPVPDSLLFQSGPWSVKSVELHLNPWVNPGEHGGVEPGEDPGLCTGVHPENNTFVSCIVATQSCDLPHIFPLPQLVQNI